MDSLENQEIIQDITLVDIEDIVPSGANSLFLSCARAIIYMSNKNSILTNALKACCSIDATHLKSDLKLQNLLRIKLCEYFCETALYKDKTSNTICLKEDYSKFFNGNIYDFLIQVYQLSINNFSNNVLFKKYALGGLSQILKIKISYKKSNGQWKVYEPCVPKSQKQPLDDTTKQYLHYLNNNTIYLQEFRTDNNNQYSCKKTVRFLLDKRLWIKNYSDNTKICLNFSQFNDSNELKTYLKYSYGISPKQIIKPFKLVDDLNFTQKIFCIFLCLAPIQLIISIGLTQKLSHSEFDYSDEFNSIGKQIVRFESISNEKLRDYFNYLCGKPVFTDDFIRSKYVQVIN